MSKQQLLERLISDIPENKLDIMPVFTKSVLYEESAVDNPLLSEPSLAKEWMLKDEDSAWENL